MKIYALWDIRKFHNDQLENILYKLENSESEYLGKLLCKNDIFHQSDGSSLSAKSDGSGLESDIECKYCHKNINIVIKVE